MRFDSLGEGHKCSGGRDARLIVENVCASLVVIAYLIKFNDGFTAVRSGKMANPLSMHSQLVHFVGGAGSAKSIESGVTFHRKNYRPETVATFDLRSKEHLPAACHMGRDAKVNL